MLSALYSILLIFIYKYDKVAYKKITLWLNINYNMNYWWKIIKLMVKFKKKINLKSINI